MPQAATVFWTLLEAALASETPRAAIEELRARGGLDRELPELEAMFGIPQRADKHPEIDCGLHSLMALEQASQLTVAPELRFAALVHDLGKIQTPREQWPSHKGHEARGVPIVEALCRRLGAPGEFRRFGTLGAGWHGLAHRVSGLPPATVLDLLEAWDALREPAGLERLIVIGMADKRGRTGNEDVPYPAGDQLRACREAAAAVLPDDRADRLRQARIAAIGRVQAEAG